MAFFFACWRYRIWSYQDYRTFQEVIKYPIGEKLWFGEIQARQKVDSLAGENPPHESLEIGG